MNRAYLLYLPVIHQGYLDFFQRSKNIEEVFIIGPDFIQELMPLHSEMRAIEPAKLGMMLNSMGYKAKVLSRNNLAVLDDYALILPKEEVSRKFAEKYLKNQKLKFVEFFLRWDEKNVYSKSNVHYDRVSTNKKDFAMIEKAAKKGKESSCWWRQVGAILIKDRDGIIFANNQHVPCQQTNYINGDPRDFIEAGRDNDIATTLHSEQLIIVEAARRGISLEGANLYVTVFPCPVCAKLIAYSGIKKVFFSSGHASLDGEMILKAKKIELIKVKKDEKK